MFGRELDWQQLESVGALELSDNEVHLWWVDLAAAARNQQQQAQFLALLPAAQQVRMQRLPNQHRRDRYLAGRGYLLRLLQVYLPVGASLELEYGEQGKPRLKAAVLPLKFNFSDTCGYGLFAFALRHELGIDLESLARRGRFQQIIQRRFSPEEQRVLDASDPAQFLSCWTRKEAYGKALGVGLRYPTQEHILCAALNQPELVTEDKHWCLQQLFLPSMPDDFVACLASAGGYPKQLRAMHLIV